MNSFWRVKFYTWKNYEITLEWYISSLFCHEWDVLAVVLSLKVIKLWNLSTPDMVYYRYTTESIQSCNYKTSLTLTFLVWGFTNYLAFFNNISKRLFIKGKFHGLSPQANYTDWAHIFLQIEGFVWSAQQIPMAVFLVFRLAFVYIILKSISSLPSDYVASLHILALFCAKNHSSDSACICNSKVFITAGGLARIPHKPAYLS
jgi:hypothetical protein